MGQTTRHVLGIDPGSVKTGYGVIAVGQGEPRHVASGVIQTGGGSFPERLLVIF
ncbi:MAG: crossover junction endodeoxyribonuclease RuvC, partial [Gammaproteobacteria bacterium]|nr:crossover junction endodeoxyribonuclease RuvC [Gammaproteobacteria bacterium]